jgi:hypothetical protein
MAWSPGERSKCTLQVERVPFGIDDCTLYPLFDDVLIRLMRETIPPEKQDSVAISVVLKAELPNSGFLSSESSL